MEIENLSPEKIFPYPGNPRLNENAVVKVAASIKEFGFRQPIVVDEKMVVIVGHTRLLAAKRLGLKSVPVHVAQGLSASKVRAYRLADNRTGEEAEWDDTKLREELSGMLLDGVDLTSTGFDADEIAKALAEEDGATDPDDVPDPPAVPASQLGDVWLLGDHRLVCGDSTDPAAVAACVGQEKPHLMVTDPPYGVEYDANWRNEVDRANGNSYGDRAIGTVSNDGRADWAEAWKLFPGDVAYVWHAGRHASVVQVSIEIAGFEIRSQIIWAKTRLIISRGDYHWQHEPCWYSVRKGKKGHWAGDRSQTTLWTIAHPKSETGHSTQKPVECMRRPMENNSKAGDAVYEPFSGSGTTIIAGEMTGRRVLAIELNPIYVDVAVRRWQDFTGKAATLHATGQTFDELSATRLTA